jgi:hypothetical protein
MFRSGKYKWAWSFFRKSILPFAVQLVALMPLILADHVGQAAARL